MYRNVHMQIDYEGSPLEQHTSHTYVAPSKQHTSLTLCELLVPYLASLVTSSSNIGATITLHPSK